VRREREREREREQFTDNIKERYGYHELVKLAGIKHLNFRSQRNLGNTVLFHGNRLDST
jgi:hypothetical protein